MSLLIDHNLFLRQYSACVSEYFQDGGCSLADGTDYEKECQKKLQGYKCVLSSKAAEESMVFDRTMQYIHVLNFVL